MPTLGDATHYSTLKPPTPLLWYCAQQNKQAKGSEHYLSKAACTLKNFYNLNVNVT